MEEKKRKDYAFRRRFIEKPSIIPGCPDLMEDTLHNSELDARQTPDLCICKLAFGLLSCRWDATEDQMPAAMRMPPPIADRPRKSLSLRERMTMHLPHSSPPQPVHFTSHESAAQPSGQTHSALPASSPDAGPVLASAKAASNHGTHQQSLPSCSTAERSIGAASLSATAAAERSARAGSVSDACVASGDASDEDLTQEDLPALPLPSNSQEEHDSPLQSSIRHEEPAGHLHDRHVDRKLQMAAWEPDKQISLGSRTAHDHLHQQKQQQQRQQQQQQERLPLQDGKEAQCCGQKPGAASACKAQRGMSKVQHPDKIESEVINLEDESADDLLDALADAAAEVPKAADDATDEGYELPDMLLHDLSTAL